MDKKIKVPEHWVNTELSKRDLALYNLGLRFASTFRHDIEKDKEINGGDAVECIQSLYELFKKESR